MTHRENILKKLGMKKSDSLGIDLLSKSFDVDKRILQEVYNRGIGAYKSNPQSVRMKGSFKKGVNAPLSQKLSKEQWASARVNSFLDKGTTFYTTDRDLAVKAGLLKA